MAQLNVSSNPYTFVRVSVMKSRLLRKEDYDRLLKMSVPEITGFLGQTEYKKEIDELAMRHSGSELVELALNKNLVSTFRKLLRISDDNLNEFISVFFKRNDIWNLSLVLRAKFSGMNPEEVRDMFLPVGQFPQEELEAMLEKSIEDIVSGLARKGLLSQSGETSQAALENSLTGNYYQSVAEFTRNIKAEGHLFLRFLQEEIAILNLVTIFKMKRDKVPSDQIMAAMFVPKLHKSLAGFVAAKDLDELFRLLQESRFSEAAQEGYEEFRKTGSLAVLESALNRRLLERTILLTHQNPLSIEVLLGYMFAKHIEVKNIRLIVKAKSLRIPQEFIEREVIA